MKSYLQLIDRRTNGPRCDVLPIYKDFKAFKEMINDSHSLSKAIPFDLVAGIDALGFILATALAIRFEKGFFPIRKGGKLPIEADRAEFTDYTHLSKSLELGKGTVSKGQRILLVDEWIETGAQMRSAIKLIETQGGKIAAILSIHIDTNQQTQALIENYRCLSLDDRP